MNKYKSFGIALAACAILAVGCTNDNGSILSSADIVQQAQGQNGAQTFVQVEQLARPGINEALLVKNTSLATYNAVGPAFIADALANPNGAAGQAAAPVLQEAVGTLTAVAALGGQNVTTLVGAFLPDVMRIDTTLSFTPQAAGGGNFTERSAYAGSVNAVGSPVGGRKLTDDVIDITLSVLSNVTGLSDNVPYYRPTTGAGSTNLNIGHQFLHNQTTQFGPSQFPFLAPPN